MAIENEGFSPSSEDVPDPIRRVRFEIIGEAWQLLLKEIGTWVLASLIFVLCSYGVSWFLRTAFSWIGLTPPLRMDDGSGVWIWILYILMSTAARTAAMAWLVGGMFSMALKQVRGQRIAVTDLFSTGGSARELTKAALFVDFAQLCASLALVLPVLPAAALLMFTLPLVVDRKLGWQEAVAQSWKALKGDWLNATLFWIVASFCGNCGVGGFGLGIVFTMPVYFLCVAALFQDFFPGERPAAAALPPPSLDV